MKIKQDGWNIVLAGIWNRAIFTPEWVGQVLFPETRNEVETLISIMPHLPIVYRDKRVAVEVSSFRLVFRPRQLDDECLQAAEKMAHVVLSKLQDTPLIGVGVNFAFVEDAPGPDISGLFDSADINLLSDNDWATQDRHLVRRLQRGTDILNLTLGFSDGNVTFEFNFHTETTDNDAASKAVDKRVLNLKGVSIQLLNSVYKLQYALGEEDRG